MPGRQCHGPRDEGRRPPRAFRPAASPPPRRRRSRDCAPASGRPRTQAIRADRPRPARFHPRTAHSRLPRGCAAPRSLPRRGRPWRTTFTTTWRIAPRRRDEPALPRTSRGRPRSMTTEGDIMLVSLSPGRGSPPSGPRSNSPSMLLRWMPVPGTITPEPEPVETVSAAALPCSSTTEMCVVPVGDGPSDAGSRARIRSSPSRTAPVAWRRLARPPR